MQVTAFQETQGVPVLNLPSIFEVVEYFAEYFAFGQLNLPTICQHDGT